MTPTLKSQWQALRRGTPGARFEERYRASRRGANRATLIQRIVRIAIAVVAVAIGLVLVFIPGPAVLFFALAGALLATESLMVARLLDGAEVRVRRLARWALRRWHALSLGGRISVATALVGLGVGAGYASYRILFG